jgi:hypothetical protein
MVANQIALDEVADFVANMNPEKLLAFKASELTQNRVTHLLEKNQESTLSSEERSEMEYFLVLDQIISLAKIRAQKLLNQRMAA